MNAARSTARHATKSPVPRRVRVLATLAGVFVLATLRADPAPLRSDGERTIPNPRVPSAADDPARAYAMNLARLAGVDPTGTASSQAPVQATLDHGDPNLYAPLGIYGFDRLDLRGKYLKFAGDGVDRTILRGRVARPALIDAAEAADVIFSPLTLTDLTLDAARLTDYAVDIRYRHTATLNRVKLQNARVANYRARDAWTSRLDDVTSIDAPIGFHFVGANHGSTYTRISTIGCTAWGIRIDPDGTAHDGNMGQTFVGALVESGAGGGVYHDGTNTDFFGGYFGEDLGGSTLRMESGRVNFFGGAHFFGSTPASPLATLNGGKVVYRGGQINGQGRLSLGGMLAGTARNAIRFEDVTAAIGVGGEPVLPGDYFDWGPGGPVFTVSPWGRAFTAAPNNVRIATADAGDSRTFTVTAAPGPNPLFGAVVDLADKGAWQTGENLFLLLVYESSKPLQVALVGGPLGTGAIKLIGAPPANPSGRRWTYVKLDARWDAGAYNHLQVALPNAAVGDFLTLHEVYLADNRFLQASPGVGFRNLYKPTGTGLRR